jgi:F-type H+-transporting ATPase subunit a
MNLRTLLVLVVIVAACYVNFAMVHHEHLSLETFEVAQLFGHLVPAAIIFGAEGAGHLAIGLPGFLSVFDMSATLGAHASSIEGANLIFTNMQVFMLMSIVLLFIVLGGIPKYVRTGKGDALTKVFAGFCMYIRDEMVYSVMGQGTGRKFLPYFLGLFFFIVFMNLVGLVPFSATPTATIATTFGLALITLTIMIGGGMIVQGPLNYIKHLVPEVPLWLWPLMFVVEIIGVVAKPFALMVRLFANMSGGHMVVLSFLGLIFLAAKGGTSMGWGASPFAVSFGVFIMIIEAFVALLQAYVFTYLSILFIQGSLHPDH